MSINQLDSKETVISSWSPWIFLERDPTRSSYHLNSSPCALGLVQAVSLQRQLMDV